MVVVLRVLLVDVVVVATLILQATEWLIDTPHLFLCFICFLYRQTHASEAVVGVGVFFFFRGG